MVCILGLSQEELCGLCALCGSIFLHRRHIRRFYNFLSEKSAMIFYVDKYTREF
jgi:hypothetical protein